MRLRCVFTCLMLLDCGGCQLFNKTTPVKPPEVVVTPSGGVSVTGEAKVPANVKTATTDSVITVPKESNLVFNEKLGTMSLYFGQASQIAVKRHETAIAGPVAFDPPKAPTVAEESKAKADFWTTLGYRAGVFIGCAAAIYGLVEQWKLVMIGGASIAGACLFGLFEQSHPILLAIIGIGAAIAFCGPYLYHTQIKPKTDPQLSNPVK